MEPTIEMDGGALSVQESDKYTVQFSDPSDTVNEGELVFNHWFYDGEGSWICINIIDGRIPVV